MKYQTHLSLETERLMLRQWRDEDRAVIREMGADARVMRYFEKTTSIEESDAFFDRIKARIDENGFGFWAAELKETRDVIGIIGLFRPRFQLPFPQDEFEIGWRLRPQFFGKGYASEGARGVLDFGFCTLGQTRLWAVTATQNRDSQKVMERIGMTNANLDFDHPAVTDLKSVALKHCTYCITRATYETMK